MWGVIVIMVMVTACFVWAEWRRDRQRQSRGV